MEILKKTVATISITTMMLSSSVSFANNIQGIVGTDTLRLRNEASTDASVLELLSKDDVVEIVGEEGDWYKVNFKNYTGYVSKEFITKKEDTRE